MRGFIGVTDDQWFAFLSSLDSIEEVNFWQPSGRRQFKALRPGEPFFFKLHAPRHYIVGGGFFAHSSLIPVSLAWDRCDNPKLTTPVFTSGLSPDPYRKSELRIRFGKSELERIPSRTLSL